MLMRRLYADIEGYSAIGAGPTGRALRYTQSHVYGELTPIGTRQLIQATKLTAADMFVDLGAGVGKVALQIALTIPGIRCIGIEVSGARYQGACRALHLAEATGMLESGCCTFQHGDIVDADLRDATILFANLIYLPEQRLNSLARKIASLERTVSFVTLHRLPERAERLLEHVGTRACQTSWDKRNHMHLYRPRQGVHFESHV